mgnify:CR=1 FL=1
MRFVLLIILSLYYSVSFSDEKDTLHSFKLKNGMEVVVIENKRAPVIAQMIWYNFGSGIEKNRKKWVSSFYGTFNV